MQLSPYPKVQALGVKDILNELARKRMEQQAEQGKVFSHKMKGTVQSTRDEHEEDEREQIIPSTDVQAQRQGLVDQPQRGNEFYQSLRKLQDLQFKAAGLVDLSKQSGVMGTSVGGGKRMPKKGKGSYGKGAKGAVRSVASNYGWDSGAEWKALQRLVQKESSWNPKAANPTSSARGLFQKMTSLHGAVEKNAKGQAKWGLKYIKKRYGSPSKALAFHLRNNWY